MRGAGRVRMGYFPLPLSEAERIRKFLLFPAALSSALDPCVGDGAALEIITNGAQLLRYGIELDAYRAEQARERIANVLHADALEAHCPVEGFGLLYENCPYDWTLEGSAEGHSSRTEQVFLNHTYRWLKPGGVLVLVIPGERLTNCSRILASHFRDVRVYRLEAPECVRYKQVVLFGVRRNRRDRERMRDEEITRARLRYASLARDPMQLPALPAEPDAIYTVPESGPVQLVARGLPLDEIEDLLPQSAAYRQAGRILFADQPSNAGRPLTPLHGGHTALLAVSSMLDGIFGSGNERHLAAWHSVKVVDKKGGRGRRGYHDHRARAIFERTDARLYGRAGCNPQVVLPRTLLPNSGEFETPRERRCTEPRPLNAVVEALSMTLAACRRTGEGGS